MSTARAAPRHAGRSARPKAAGAAAPATRRTIVHITAEYFPYARTGGLAEAVAGLANVQARMGATVVVFMPLYPPIREVAADLEPLTPRRTVAIGDRLEEVRYFAEAAPAAGARVIFVDAPEYFARAGIYGEHGADYPDNHRRFALFSRAALEGMVELVPGPVLLHAHDWHTALAPVYLRSSGPFIERYPATPVVLSVHNAGYQGHFPDAVMQELGLPWELWSMEHLEWYGQLNVLKGGLTSCDIAITVSRTHATELCTAEGGFGLHDTFRQLGSRLIGIRNGIDQIEWDPATDPSIAATFSRDDLDGKRACKQALQRSFGLAERPEVLLFGMTGRLVQQKGFDLILESDRIRALDAQFIFLGQGEPRYHDALAALARAHPHRIVAEFGFTGLLEHRLMAGSDIVLMPSLYEPCGLTQMRAQRYGAPVVGRRVGGISDTVQDDATGFLFDAFAADAFDAAIDCALTAFADGDRWTGMMQRAMAVDVGWAAPAAAYADAYASAERLAAEHA